MLIFTRRIGETFVIGDNTFCKVLGVKGNQVRIGIDAPSEISVHREEIFLKVKAEREVLMGMDSEANISLTGTYRRHSKMNALAH